MDHHFSQSSKSQRFIVLLPLLLAVLAPNRAQAELSYLDLKGVDALVDYPGASPVYGYTALKTALENRRFFGNYGPKNDSHGCMEGASVIHGILVKNEDCPRDHFSEWLQRLFPSQDGANFVANQVESDPISHLRSELIGKILQRIHDVPEGAWADPQAMQALEMDLMAELFRDLNPLGYVDWLKRQRKDFGRLTTERNTAEKKSRSEKCSVEQKAILSQQAQELSIKVAMIETFLARATPAAAATDSGPKGIGKEGDYRNIAHMLVGALKESRLDTPPKYPKYLPEQALLAFFLQKKANSKADLIELFQGMPKLLKDPDFLNSKPKQAAFNSAYWTSADYHPKALARDPVKTAQEFEQHPEKLIFAVRSEEVRNRLPPQVGYARARHPDLKAASSDGKYPDCGETSLRNFFNFILYHPEKGQYDVELFNPTLKVKKELLDFYQGRTIAQDSNEATRDLWSESVLPVAPDRVQYYARYKSGQKCEINAGLDNMMEVLDLLLYHPESQGASPSPLKRLSTRSEKLDHLCNVLARAGEHLTWSVQGYDPGADSQRAVNEKNIGVTILFQINGKPSFNWVFDPWHFEGRPLPESKPSWREAVAEQLLQRAKAPEHHDSALRALMVLASEPQFDQLTSHLAGDFQTLFYSLPLKKTEAQIAGFRKIVAEHPQEMKSVAFKLKKKLEALNDGNALTEVYSALADANNPYDGDTIHPLGKPDAVYTRVSPQKLAEKYGAAAAKKMGRSWSREMFGRQVIIGEPLVDESGTELYMNFSDAREACINLNSPEQRTAVRDALQKREAALNAVRKSNPADLEKQIKEIYSAHPIPGIYLMSKDEGNVIEDDLGYREGKYVPQILPKMKMRYFWSSSCNSVKANFGFNFFDLYGVFYNGDCNRHLSVRCGAA